MQFKFTALFRANGKLMSEWNYERWPKDVSFHKVRSDICLLSKWLSALFPSYFVLIQSTWGYTAKCKVYISYLAVPVTLILFITRMRETILYGIWFSNFVLAPCQTDGDTTENVTDWFLTRHQVHKKNYEQKNSWFIGIFFFIKSHSWNYYTQLR